MSFVLRFVLLSTLYVVSNCFPQSGFPGTIDSSENNEPIISRSHTVMSKQNDIRLEDKVFTFETSSTDSPTSEPSDISQTSSSASSTTTNNTEANSNEAKTLLTVLELHNALTQILLNSTTTTTPAPIVIADAFDDDLKQKIAELLNKRQQMEGPVKLGDVEAGGTGNPFQSIVNALLRIIRPVVSVATTTSTTTSTSTTTPAPLPTVQINTVDINSIVKNLDLKTLISLINQLRSGTLTLPTTPMTTTTTTTTTTAAPTPDPLDPELMQILLQLIRYHQTHQQKEHGNNQSGKINGGNPSSSNGQILVPAYQQPANNNVYRRPHIVDGDRMSTNVYKVSAIVSHFAEFFTDFVYQALLPMCSNCATIQKK